MRSTWLFGPLAMTLALAGCAATTQTTMIDQRADRSAIGAGLDMRDFQGAASAATATLLASPAMTKPGGGRYVVIVGQVTNDTVQRVDTDLLIRQIRVALLNSGRFVFTTASEDPMAMQTRELRGSAEFKQATVAGRGQMIAPDLSMTGKILQNIQRLGDGSQRIDYQFQLSMTDIHTGLALWEDVEPVSKLTSNRTVTW